MKLARGVTPYVNARGGKLVTPYVNARGGKLYLWGEPFGGFTWVHVDIQAPHPVEFVKSRAVSEFELYVDRSLQQYPRMS